MKFSIVVPSFNQGAFLGRTLESVLSQTGDFDLEVLVMDGGSTDQTLDVLRGIEDARVSWVSESDRGQAHAINKGLERATGDIVTWLNSDDLYLPGALATVAQTFDAHPDACWVVGRARVIDEQDRPIRSVISRYKDRKLRHYTYRKLLRENFICQMGVFWRRSFGDRVGPLDESLYYVMDYELWLRMGELTDPVILDREVAAFRLYPGSKTGAVNRKQFDQQYEVACRHFGRDWWSRVIHRLNVEKIVWAYRAMRLLGI